jgi:hypothetical protein
MSIATGDKERNPMNVLASKAIAVVGKADEGKGRGVDTNTASTTANKGEGRDKDRGKAENTSLANIIASTSVGKGSGGRDKGNGGKGKGKGNGGKGKGNGGKGRGKDAGADENINTYYP